MTPIPYYRVGPFLLPDGLVSPCGQSFTQYSDTYTGAQWRCRQVTACQDSAVMPLLLAQPNDIEATYQCVNVNRVSQQALRERPLTTPSGTGIPITAPYSVFATQDTPTADASITLVNDALSFCEQKAQPNDHWFVRLKPMASPADDFVKNPAQMTWDCLRANL